MYFLGKSKSEQYLGFIPFFYILDWALSSFVIQFGDIFNQGLLILFSLQVILFKILDFKLKETFNIFIFSLLNKSNITKNNPYNKSLSGRNLLISPGINHNLKLNNSFNNYNTLSYANLLSQVEKSKLNLNLISTNLNFSFLSKKANLSQYTVLNLPKFFIYKNQYKPVNKVNLNTTNLTLSESNYLLSNTKLFNKKTVNNVTNLSLNEVMYADFLNNNINMFNINLNSELAKNLR